MSQIISSVNLSARISISGELEAKTGLHIGGNQSGIDIGGIDNYVIRDPLTQQPYIPGSSLKGKLRSLLEKRYELPQNNRVGRAYIHSCGKITDFKNCPVCPVFGISAEEIKEIGADGKRLITLTRVVIRDAHLKEESAEILQNLKTDLQFTEVKTEVVIDRLTSAAGPRTIERIPAGAIFNFEIIFSIYENEDLDRFSVIPEALQLLQDDYLGGLGSRGSGQVVFNNLKVLGRKVADYSNPVFNQSYTSLAELISDDALIANIKNLTTS